MKYSGRFFSQPKQKRAGIVQRGVNLRMLLEEIHERLIGFFVAGFEDTAEIAARLMRVNEQGEMELCWCGGRRHGTGRSLFRIVPCRPEIVQNLLGVREMRTGVGCCG